MSHTITYGSILSLYLFLHLVTSPANLAPGTALAKGVASDLMADPMEFAASLIAFTISYLLRTAVVASQSPESTSFVTHQNIMAFWELYLI